MATTFDEALQEAKYKFLTTVNKDKLGETHRRLFDDSMPRVMNAMVEELTDPAQALSATAILQRINERKWAEILGEKGFFARDTYAAQREIAKRLDQFAIDVLAAQE